MARAGRGTIVRYGYRPIPRRALYDQVLSATLNAAGINVRSVEKSLDGSLLASSLLARSFTLVKLFDSALVPSAFITRDVSVSVEGTISSSSLLDDIFVIALALVGSVSSISGSIVYSPSKYLTGQLDTAATIVKSSTRLLSSSVLASSVQEKILQRVLESYLVPQGNTAEILSAFRTLDGTILPAAVLRKVSRKPVEGHIATSGSIRRTASKFVSGAIAMAATFISQRVGDINSISASISIETIINITLVYEDTSVVLTVDGI